MQTSIITVSLDKSTLTKSLHGYSGSFPDFHIVSHSASPPQTDEACCWRFPRLPLLDYSTPTLSLKQKKLSSGPAKVKACSKKLSSKI